MNRDLFVGFGVLTIIILAIIGFTNEIYKSATNKLICEDQVYTVTQVGGCHSDRDGGGSCGTMLDNTTYVRLTAPVIGERVQKCKNTYDNREFYKRAK